jgi:hypothetical protein
MWCKQSTAATLIVGPILDSAGAEFTTAAIGDLSISKNGGTLTALSGNTFSHIANGQYSVTLTTSNLDTLGRLQITCNRATYQMPPVGLTVVPAMVFDSMVLGTDVLQSDVTQFGGTNGTFTDGKPTAVLDSASRLAIWNTLTTETFTADTFGELLLISDGTNGRAVKVTGANHIAADVHDCQADGLSGSTEIGNIQDAAGWLLAISSGAVANPQTATEQYDITQFGVNYRVAMAGLTSTGTRTAPTLSKPA